MKERENMKEMVGRAFLLFAEQAAHERCQAKLRGPMPITVLVYIS